MTNRRKFSTEFRAEAVELVISSGRPIAQVAPEIVVVLHFFGQMPTRPRRCMVLPAVFARNGLHVSAEIRADLGEP